MLMTEAVALLLLGQDIWPQNTPFANSAHFSEVFKNGRVPMW